jgi:hypothetical protein
LERVALLVSSFPEFMGKANTLRDTRGKTIRKFAMAEQVERVP